MAVKILFIGDPHFQVTNIPEIDKFMVGINSLAKRLLPDLIIIAGDLLHTHERLHTIALNKAYNLVDNMRLISKTYILVGNHDYIQNQQFLTDNHWMNGMKQWENTVVVDRVIFEVVNGLKFVFTPYVPNGRFIEALDTLGRKQWADASCIFAHQEFFGCKMGAITSVEGDKWSEEYPQVVSGHIHSRQIPQSNIYYSGSALQHAFGESEKNIIAYLTFTSASFSMEEFDLELPRKKIVYMDVEDVNDYSLPLETEDKVKLTVSGVYEQFKALKKTKKYKKLVEQGVKIVFKPKKIEVQQSVKNVRESMDKILTSNDAVSFNDILEGIIQSENNTHLSQLYSQLIKDTATTTSSFTIYV